LEEGEESEGPILRGGGMKTRSEKRKGEEILRKDGPGVGQQI
jgi:hypothetical protein